jgi:hypothetical protein
MQLPYADETAAMFQEHNRQALSNCPLSLTHLAMITVDMPIA